MKYVILYFALMMTIGCATIEPQPEPLRIKSIVPGKNPSPPEDMYNPQCYSDSFMKMYMPPCIPPIGE